MSDVSGERVVQGVFFFQAEDGIRDVAVTGVQTCALPILVVAVLAGWAGLLRPTAEFLTHSYATATGEVRHITLPDGSIVYLNTQTRLRWTGTQHDRRVSLESGEAFFDVVPDPLRPFRIALARSEIRVLGTRFDVYRKSSGKVLVTVLNTQTRLKWTGTLRRSPGSPGGRAACRSTSAGFAY